MAQGYMKQANEILTGTAGERIKKNEEVDELNFQISQNFDAIQDVNQMYSDDEFTEENLTCKNNRKRKLCDDELPGYDGLVFLFNDSNEYKITERIDENTLEEERKLPLVVITNPAYWGVLDLTRESLYGCKEITENDLQQLSQDFADHINGNANWPLKGTSLQKLVKQDPPHGSKSLTSDEESDAKYDSAIAYEINDENTVTYFTKELTSHVVNHTLTPVEYPATSPEGVAYVFNIEANRQSKASNKKNAPKNKKPQKSTKSSLDKNDFVSDTKSTNESLMTPMERLEYEERMLLNEERRENKRLRFANTIKEREHGLEQE
ncbi:hypothetical protein C2G38_2146486 [Gigaspora rosea]|uniref:Uncharacterized protein n=1 Tax=Gigaspora rosea TaxID=44941 RepID=A0A397UQ97_9GLOM|nr:hypothetical protein C2G38_2146486 [Gigaspora rosea]